MTIRDISAITLHAPIAPKDRVESGAGEKVARQATLVVVSTEDGRRGIASSSGPYDAAAVQAVLREASGLLRGRDPWATTANWHSLYRGHLMRNVGRSGIAVAVLSAVDTALWDLKARDLGVPLFELMGGRGQSGPVRCYASSVYWSTSPSEASEEVARYKSEGFTAVKFKVGRDLPADIQRIRRVKDDHPEILLLADANQTCSRAQAAVLLEALDDFEVEWFEEPLEVRDFEGHAALRARARRCAIASGENFYTMDDAARAFAHGSLDVIQTDISRVGGVTEHLRIVAAADAHAVRWHPHTFNDALTVAVNLHGVVAHSSTPPLFEWDVTYNPLMQMPGAPVLSAGSLPIPTAPGLGVDIDEVLNWAAAFPWDGSGSIASGY